MHEGGVNHRDCYICHFLLKVPFNGIGLPKLSIIDLHRAQIRRGVPQRWRNKDITALYYSTMKIGLKGADYLRFIKKYFNNQSIRCILKAEGKFFAQINFLANKIASRTQRKGL